MTTPTDPETRARHLTVAINDLHTMVKNCPLPHRSHGPRCDSCVERLEAIALLRADAERPTGQACQECATKDSQYAEVMAVIEAVHCALAGEPVSEFMESFTTVRRVIDQRAQLAEAQQECATHLHSVKLYQEHVGEKNKQIGTLEAQLADAQRALGEQRQRIDKFAEDFDTRFWTLLNRPGTDDYYISRQEALKWQARLTHLAQPPATEVPDAT